MIVLAFGPTPLNIPKDTNPLYEYISKKIKIYFAYDKKDL